MGNPQWFDALRLELQHRRLPPRYVERLIQELTDHVNDLTEENLRMEAPPSLEMERTIGTPAEVAEAAAAQYPKPHFCGSHPIMTFVVLPIPLVLLTFALSIATLAGTWEGIEFVLERLFGIADSDDSLRQWLARAPEASWMVGFGIVIVPLTLAMIVLRKLAAVSGKSWRWLLVACLLVLVAAKAMYVETIFSEIPGRSRIMMGLMWHSHPFRFRGAEFLQCLVTLAIGGYLIWRLARRQRREMAL